MVWLKIKFKVSNEYCYSRQYKKGNITEDKYCNGLTGGDRYSGYLCYSCVDCKYFNNGLNKTK